MSGDRHNIAQRYTFALRNPKAIQYPPTHTRTWGNLGDNTGGGKWRAGEQKRQSQKRVKIEEKLLWNGLMEGLGLRNSPTLF